MKTIIATALLATATYSRADMSFTSPDGRRVLVISRSVSMHGTYDKQVAASANGALYTTRGESLGVAKIAVTGCTPGQKQLLWDGGYDETPMKWQPGGLTLWDRIGDAICADMAKLRASA